MNLQSITVRNFKSYGPQPQTVNLRNIDALGIGGRNGAGKTSLVEALTFALYGKASATELRELGEGSLINDRANEAYVSVTFEKDGNIYTVERTIRKKGPSKARLTSPILPKPIADVKAVNSKIESLLGMDYETFISSTIIRQDEMDRLTARRPAERKEILANIFGLQAYEAMRVRAHDKAWEIKNRIAAFEERKKMLEGKILQEESLKEKLMIHEEKIKALKEECSKKEDEKTRIEKKLDELQKMKIEHDKIRSEVNSLTEQLRRDESRLDNLKMEIQNVSIAAKELESLKPLKEEKARLRQGVEALTQQREQLKLDITKLNERIQEINNRVQDETENYRKIKEYKIPECPLCKRPLDELHRSQLLRDYEMKIASLNRDYEILVSEIQNIKNTLDGELNPSIQEKQAALKEMEMLDEKIGSLTAVSSRMPRLIEEQRRLAEPIDENRKRIKELEERLRVLAPNIESYRNLEDDRKRMEEELRRIERELGIEKANKERVEKDLAEIEQAKAEHGRIIEQIGQEGKIKAAYECLERRVFHKDGIPTAILKEVIPEIEQEASKILRELSGGRMDIRFTLGRKTRAGKTTDELIVEAVDQTGSHPVSRYSGGERMRINLALRLGISEVVAKRSGYMGRIETLIIDEGFGPLDEEGRRATVEILQALRQRFSKIIVISHIDDVREAFESRLIVEKPVGGYSSINII
ncbi:SMC family ATPase [Candidatus Bathyarchaeota archaeon]|nr:SMC family ATPase [Candidatus Bathyarchaeota archaeon]